MDLVHVLHLEEVIARAQSAELGDATRVRPVGDAGRVCARNPSARLDVPQVLRLPVSPLYQRGCPFNQYLFEVSPVEVDVLAPFYHSRGDTLVERVRQFIPLRVELLPAQCGDEE